MASGFSLKDQLFNADKTRYLAGLFAAATPEFDAPAFEAEVAARLPDLELKERISWIAECLGRAVPGALPEVVPVLRAALPPPLDPALKDDDFGDFIFAPLGEWIGALGLESHPDLSLDLLEQVTQRFSMEWAIRPFLNRYPDLVLERMQDWVAHDSYHVRRLVSEGTRPRLPWGQAVGLALGDPLPLLDRLHKDETRYVTRSVANHLNDVTKKDPDLAMDRLADWAGGSAQELGELRWMTAHALRGLVKAGHPRAMAMLGYDPEARIEARIELAAGRVKIGEMLEFDVHLSALEITPVLVDFCIHFLRPGGKVSAKVFKLKQLEAGPGEVVLRKRHRLKGDATTFTLVPGEHRLDLMVNGRVRDEVSFDLTG